jgi:hypothetical protein
MCRYLFELSLKKNEYNYRKAFWEIYELSGKAEQLELAMSRPKVKRMFLQLSMILSLALKLSKVKILELLMDGIK